MAAPATGSALTPGARAGIDLRGWLAALPVRFDDRRFWPRAALGLGLRWLALEGEWRPLCEGVTRAAAAALHAAGVAIDATAADQIVVAGKAVAITASCVHVDVLALAAPLLWDRSRSIAHNLRLLAAAAIALLAAAVIRIDLAVALLSRGVPWALGHDVVLGVGYFAFLAAVLRRGAWTRSRT